MISLLLLSGTTHISIAEAAIPRSYWVKHLFVLPKGNYNTETADQMIDRILRIRPAMLEALVYAGVPLKLVKGKITDEPEMARLRGSIPKGWETTGKTWDDVPGVGGNPVIVRIGYSERGKGHGSHNLELHETFHAIDRFVFGDVSHSSAFVALFREEARLLFAGDGYEETFPEEYFAEVSGMYYFSEETKAAVKRNLPKTYAFLHDLFISYKPEPPRIAELSHHWAKTPMERLAAMRIMKGFPDRTLRPAAVVTREQFIKLLVQALGLRDGRELREGSSGQSTEPGTKPDAGQLSFSDVSESGWSFPYIETGAANGIFAPEDFNGKFQPLQPLTRAEMAIWTARALQLQPDEQAFAYADAGKVKRDRGLIGASVSAGLMTGVLGDRFDPDGIVTRAQAAAVLDRVLSRSD
jgi:hypothetical protein